MFQNPKTENRWLVLYAQTECRTILEKYHSVKMIKNWFDLLRWMRVLKNVNPLTLIVQIGQYKITVTTIDSEFVSN